ncbi:ImmA/IrrE family metallo-endopeptidase [Moraxella sp. ZJ142]|uniref:ImmA/IrrE family metallo-endopeptidase n=1 Tax=Moraxella marmotae TaxID=3344520 RepID=UPI0035D49040
MPKNNMQLIYKKLIALGFSKNQIKKQLPDWWCDEIATTPAGLQQAELITARTFGLEFSSLHDSLQDDSLPKFRVSQHQFKHSKNLQKDRLQPAVATAMFAADITLSAFDQPVGNLPKTAMQVRQTVLTNHQWVDFYALADFCWSVGIPVIHLANLPTPKMDGLAFIKQNRPVIVLTKKNKHGALVFDLAHELGHILLGHVQEKQIILDKKIDKTDDSDLEQQADAFALELLTGDPKAQFATSKSYSPQGLAQAMIAKGLEMQIDPLHMVLNYAYVNQKFALAQTALKIMTKKLVNQQTDQQIAQSLYLHYVDMQSIDDDEIVKYLIGVE